MFQLVLSLVGRKKLVAVNVILNVLQAILGGMLLIVVVWACLSSSLHPSDRWPLQLVFIMVSFYGLLVVILGVQGIRLSATYFSASLRESLGLELAVWIVVATLATIIGIGFMFALPHTSKSFLAHLQNSMFRGMGQYLQDSSWKEFYDHVQFDLECCGVMGDSDWRTTSWIPLEQLRENSRTVLAYTKADGRTLPPIVPYSCCNLRISGQCLHDHLQQRDLFLRVKDNKDMWWNSIHKDGCFQRLSSSISHQVTAAIVIILFTCIIFLVTIALSGYIHLRSKGRGIDGIFRRKKTSKHHGLVSEDSTIFLRKKTSKHHGQASEDSTIFLGKKTSKDHGQASEDSTIFLGKKTSKHHGQASEDSTITDRIPFGMRSSYLEFSCVSYVSSTDEEAATKHHGQASEDSTITDRIPFGMRSSYLEFSCVSSTDEEAATKHHGQASEDSTITDRIPFGMRSSYLEFSCGSYTDEEAATKSSQSATKSRNSSGTRPKRSHSSKQTASQ